VVVVEEELPRPGLGLPLSRKQQLRWKRR